jgi:hypothetical protein
MWNYRRAPNEGKRGLKSWALAASDRAAHFRALLQNSRLSCPEMNYTLTLPSVSVLGSRELNHTHRRHPWHPAATSFLSPRRNRFVDRGTPVVWRTSRWHSESPHKVNRQVTLDDFQITWVRFPTMETKVRACLAKLASACRSSAERLESPVAKYTVYSPFSTNSPNSEKRFWVDRATSSRFDWLAAILCLLASMSSLAAFVELYNNGRNRDYPFGFLQMKLDATGKGTGPIMAAAKIRFDKKKGKYENRELRQPVHQGYQPPTAIVAPLPDFRAEKTSNCCARVPACVSIPV